VAVTETEAVVKRGDAWPAIITEMIATITERVQAGCAVAPTIASAGVAAVVRGAAAAAATIVGGATVVAAGTTAGTESAAPVKLKTFDVVMGLLPQENLRTQTPKLRGVLEVVAEPTEMATKKTTHRMRPSWWARWRGGRRRGGVATRTT